jgi:hypothetical protein
VHDTELAAVRVGEHGDMDAVDRDVLRCDHDGAQFDQPRDLGVAVGDEQR